MREPLTPKQQDIYIEIRRYIEEKQEAPTLEELRQAIKAGSINTVVQRLKILEKKGYIFRPKNVKRNIELRDDPSKAMTTTITVPVIASVGCDNLSVLANENHDEFIEVDKKLMENKGEVVAVRAVGDSMNDANINNGDYVLVQVTDRAENGDRVVAIVGDTVTVKRYERRDGLTILRPESKDPQYKPIILNEEFKIAGKVIRSIPSGSLEATEYVPIKDKITGESMMRT